MQKQTLISILINRPGVVLLLFSGLLLISILMTGLLEFEQDIFKVLPQNNPVVKVLIHALKTSTAQNRLLLVVSGPEDAQKLIRSGKDLIRDLESIRIDEKPVFETISFQKTGAFSSEDFLELLSCYLKRPELFIAQEDLPRLYELFSSPTEMENQLKRSLALLAVPGAQGLSGIIALDPLNFRKFLLEKLQAMHQGLEFGPGPDLISVDGQTLLIIATPVYPAGDHAKARLLLNAIDRVREARPGLNVGITGGYAIAAQEAALVREDILGCLLGSVLGVSLLFLLIYRNPAVLIFILLPLGVGLQLALGVMSIACNPIHLLAMAFATVVLGLGIDFGVHVYDRYAMERQSGEPMEVSLERSVFNTGAAVLAGCLTTLSAFLVLTLTNSPILHQIAWFVSLGLLFCLITILLALPACLIWLEQRFGRRPTHPMLFLGTDRLGSLISNFPKTLLVFSAIFVLAAFPGVLRLKFETDISNLRPKGLESLKVQEELLEAFAGGRQYALASWTAGDIQSFWEKGRAVDDALDRLKKTDIITSWSSLGRISSEKPLFLKNIDLAGIKALFGRYGLDLEQFRETYQFLARIGGTTHLDRNDTDGKAGPTPCNALNNLPDLFKRFFMCENDVIRGIAWIMMPADAGTSSVTEALKTSCEGLSIVNPSLAVKELVGEVRNELKMTLGSVALLIIVILLGFFRKPSALVFVLMPVAMGLFVTAGIMGWAGVNLNPFNFIVLPILVGIGLDDGIHIYRRYQEMGDIQKTLTSTGRSVLVTTLTTVFGFGSLFLADYHVLKSMGIMAIVGVLACFVFSVVTLPAILKIRRLP